MFAAVALSLLALVYMPPLPEALTRAREGTPRVLDSRGGLLREPPGPDGLRAEWIPLEIPASDHSRAYLRTKKEKLGHKLNGV